MYDEPRLIPAALLERIENYRERQTELKAVSYKEASARVEFIDALLGSLGWDVANGAGLPERFKDVVVEPNQDVEGHKRAPDYVLRVAGQRKMFVEAKKPAVWLKNQKEPAYQARRYGWSAQLPLVVLTNFREIAVYDARVRPFEDDQATKARLLYFSIDEYEERWEELYNLISRDAVASGSLDAFIAEAPGRRGAERIDRVFLRDLEVTRGELLAHVADKNPSLTDAQLLNAIQLTLDRIIFLRFCEDRSIEPYGTLRDAAASKDPMKALTQVYRDADARYNSGLFHFDDEKGRVRPDELTLSLTIDDEVIRRTVMRFYPPESPYAFGVMPVDVLGKAYETFLSWRITRAGGKVALELKPEVRKAGGVFYTPEWLSTEVLERTLRPLLVDKTPDDIRPTARNAGLRVVDPACGSGSFLVHAYRSLLDWHLHQYLLEPQKWLQSRPPRLEKNSLGEFALSTGERRRILVDHIFGVDIDAQAVEVAKLSLLLTFMEDHEASDAAAPLPGFKARILPDLDRNVMCGNSLVDNEILTDDELADVHNPERVRLNPFDWTELGGDFTAVVGNPPWLMAGYEIEPRALGYLKSDYETYDGKADLYYLFIERGIHLLRDGGRLGFVVPNKMYTTRAATRLRKTLTDKPLLEEIVDFQAARLFDEAANYSQILILAKQARARPEPIRFSRATERMAVVQDWAVPRDRLGSASWDLSSPEAHALWEHLRSQGTALEDVAAGFGNGVQTGSDPIMILDRAKAEELKIESAYIRDIVRGQDIRDGSMAASKKVIVFPYQEVNGAYRVINASDLSQAPWLEAYLHANEKALRSRRWFKKSAEQLTGQWWGLMYLAAPSTFGGRHLLTPSLSGRSNFALGDGRLFPTGTAGVTSIDLPADMNADALLAVLNSPLISTYIIAHSPVYQGNYHKFSKPYIAHAPIKLPHADAESETWDRLGQLWATRSSLPIGTKRDVVDVRIGRVVNDYYGVDEGQLAHVKREVAALVSD
ncbi:N-6 DNA methylase [Agromyces sp. SYSU K20354]|uniref:Eco57I restriction-modification methylase domain-containing protein n=1 Tax=Agromyces cavernae TaxID=2898659 RepID=UPI001E63919E|nr:N-6 DNA methylase [Agromyces cavernae]MCD2443462.1 N-6 DNA methylase [Agromyces cavernae]